MTDGADALPSNPPGPLGLAFVLWISANFLVALAAMAGDITSGFAAGLMVAGALTIRRRDDAVAAWAVLAVAVVGILWTLGSDRPIGPWRLELPFAATPPVFLVAFFAALVASRAQLPLPASLAWVGVLVAVAALVGSATLASSLPSLTERLTGPEPVLTLPFSDLNPVRTPTHTNPIEVSAGDAILRVDAETGPFSWASSVGERTERTFDGSGTASFFVHRQRLIVTRRSTGSTRVVAIQTWPGNVEAVPPSRRSLGPAAPGVAALIVLGLLCLVAIRGAWKADRAVRHAVTLGRAMAGTLLEDRRVALDDGEIVAVEPGEQDPGPVGVLSPSRGSAGSSYREAAGARWRVVSGELSRARRDNEASVLHHTATALLAGLLGLWLAAASTLG